MKRRETSFPKPKSCCTCAYRRVRRALGRSSNSSRGVELKKANSTTAPVITASLRVTSERAAKLVNTPERELRHYIKVGEHELFLVGSKANLCVYRPQNHTIRTSTFDSRTQLIKTCFAQRLYIGNTLIEIRVFITRFVEMNNVFSDTLTRWSK